MCDINKLQRCHCIMATFSLTTVSLADASISCQTFIPDMHERKAGFIDGVWFARDFDIFDSSIFAIVFVALSFDVGFGDGDNGGFAF